MCGETQPWERMRLTLLTQRYTHIEIKSQSEHHTINRVELAAITIALELNKDSSSLNILTDSAFNINSIRNYCTYPLYFTNHPHSKHLYYADKLLRTRDAEGYTANIGKIKSHTGVSQNYEAGTCAQNVAEGHTPSNINFTGADPPVDGMRTWPQIQTVNPNKATTTRKKADLHNGTCKLIQQYTSTTVHPSSTTYGAILRHARANRADRTIHGYSTPPHRARRDSL